MDASINVTVRKAGWAGTANGKLSHVRKSLAIKGRVSTWLLLPALRPQHQTSGVIVHPATVGRHARSNLANVILTTVPMVVLAT